MVAEVGRSVMGVSCDGEGVEAVAEEVVVAAGSGEKAVRWRQVDSTCKQ